MAEVVDSIDSMGLVEALDLLRAEVAEARRRADEADVRFPVQSLTVEFKLGLTRTAGGRVGFKVPFLELGGEGRTAKETVHTITAGDLPIDEAGRPVRVADAVPGMKD